MIEINGASRNAVATLEDLYVPTRDGASAPLSAIAQPRLQSGYANIDRYDRRRAVTVTASVVEGHLPSKVGAEALHRIQREVDFPPGYALSTGGQAKEQSEGMSGLGAAVFIAIFGILSVLVLEFGRLRSAIAVASIIPFGIFGAVAALWVTGHSLSFTATIGVIAVIGIEIKDSILLVDFTEQMIRQGKSLYEAIMIAGEKRFLPVFLTSVTAICGLLPLAFGKSGLYSPLAIAIIGGLVSSTVLSRVATPVTYWLISRKRGELVPAGAAAVHV
jgi:multidrug efflux pump subunit AcrB